jgi:methylthioribulose-1-phosphate dehydratase
MTTQNSAQEVQSSENNDHLITSQDPQHPANLIPELCRKFWHLGWVTGTGGGASIRNEFVSLPPAASHSSFINMHILSVI